MLGDWSDRIADICGRRDAADRDHGSHGVRNLRLELLKVHVPSGEQKASAGSFHLGRGRLCERSNLQRAKRRSEAHIHVRNMRSCLATRPRQRGLSSISRPDVRKRMKVTIPWHDQPGSLPQRIHAGTAVFVTNYLGSRLPRPPMISSINFIMSCSHRTVG